MTPSKRLHKDEAQSAEICLFDHAPSDTQTGIVGSLGNNSKYLNIKSFSYADILSDAKEITSNYYFLNGTLH